VFISPSFRTRLYRARAVISSCAYEHGRSRPGRWRLSPLTFTRCCALQCSESAGVYTVSPILLAAWTYSDRALFLHRSASRLSARRQDLYQICGECSERLAWASSGQASLVGMRLAASMRAARAGWPRSSKSSSAVCNSNRFAPWRRASSRAAPMSARRASGRVVEDLHLAPRRHARARHQPLF
jgi:hypothetical protein